MISLCTHLFLVTRAAWERFEFLIKRVGDSRSFPFAFLIMRSCLSAEKKACCVIKLVGPYFPCTSIYMYLL